MTITTEGRRCALPGCYVVIEPEPDGRPQRKYCTAAHRAVARQMRREGTHRSAAIVSAPAAPAEPPEPLEARPPVPSRRRSLALAALRRCRAAAVLGSAGLLVTGGGLMSASSPAGTPTAASSTPWNAADPDSQQQWAGQAKITLASLDSQLQRIDQADRSWNALPASRKYLPLPAPIRNLHDQRTLLVTQRQLLQNEIATYDHTQQARRQLADTEDGLSAIDSTLDQAGAPTGSAQQAHTIALLNQEKQQQTEQRDAQRAQLAELHRDLQRAMATPLPADDSSTRSLTDQVTNLVDHPELDRSSRRPGQVDARPNSPEVTPPREQDGPEADQVGNGAPPNPGRARPETPPAPEVLAQGAPPLPEPAVPPTVTAAPGVAGVVGGAVGGVVKALPRLGAPAPTAPTPAAPAPTAPAAPTPAATPAPAPAAHAPGGLLGEPLGGVTRALPGVGAPPAPPAAAAPSPSVGTPSRGSGGGLLDSPTVPLNPASGPSALDNGGWGAHQASHDNGGFGQVESPPVSRVAESTPDSSPTTHPPSHPDRDRTVPDVSGIPLLPAPSTPSSTPSDSDRSNGELDSGTHDSKAEAAGEIAGSVLGGDWGDLVSDAVRAKEAQDGHASQDSDPSSYDGEARSGDAGDYSDLRDSILRDYGVSSDSDSHQDSHSDSGRASDRGWGAIADRSDSSDHGSRGSSDLDSIIDRYSDTHSDSHDSGGHDSDSRDFDDGGWDALLSSSHSHDSDSDSDDSDSHDSDSHDDYSSDRYSHSHGSDRDSGSDDYRDGDSHGSRDDSRDSYDSDSDSHHSYDSGSYDSGSHDSYDSDSRDSDSHDSDDSDSHDSYSDDDHDSGGDHDSDSDSDRDSGGDHDSDSDSGGHSDDD